MKNNIILENYVEDYSQLMVIETFKILKESSIKRHLNNEVYLKFLSYYITTVLLDCLNKYAKDTKLTPTEKYKLTRDSFLTSKKDIQEAVTSGFERAFLTFAGKKVDYYCLINPTPDSINKIPV